MLRKLSTCFIATLLACSSILPMQHIQIQAREEVEQTNEYTLYPKPQAIVYGDGSFILQEELHIVYDEKIDVYTKKRMEETAASKKLKISTSNQAEAGKTNIFIGIYNSKGVADKHIQSTYEITESTFEHIDSYVLKTDNGSISILGKDSDAAFYGITTLFQVFGQMDSLRIQNFEINDYADVKSRGFIEGYYGNPWSLEDRIDLMKFGGYYKLNAYFYAPKDDPKHNAKWRELYTEEELVNIKALADAGNESKCRFVFALHPFMNSAMRFDTEAHYQEDLTIMKAKFKQVIDQGVRQISILDDDAPIPGGNANNAVRVIKDMTSWLEEVQEEYPDMKLTLPYVPAGYMGTGADQELQTLKQAPDNVQIVMTGGRVWGEVSKSFTETFTANMGKGPFLWINWPCTDNSKKHLIMGGNTTFLHPGVDPAKIQGIMLNPMQQSEPSKVAIFANAAYAWNIWESNEEADKAWDDSFSFVDHNTAIESESSKALREISKHMINQNMDSRVTPLQESIDLKELLTPYKDKLKKGTVTIAETDTLINEFELLQKAAKTYRNNAGNTRTRDQIIPWLNCWDDTTTATIAYLKGIKASLLNDTSSVMKYLSEGQQAFEQSKTYGYHYVDHTEYAEVGVQHIVPFVKATGTYLNDFVKAVIDPSIVSKQFITSRSDNPTGDVANVFDGSDATNIIFKTPASIFKDDYVGALFSKAIDIKNIRFLLGGGKDHFDQCKVQYTVDGSTWVDLDGTLYNGVTGKEQEVKLENLSIHAKGVRLIATKANARDAWLQVNEIQVNKEKEDVGVYYPSTISLDKLSEQSGNGKAKIIDGNTASEAWLAKGPYTNPDRELVPVGATVTLTFDSVKPIGKIYIAQGMSAAADVLTNASLEYLKEDGTWDTIATINNSKEQTFDISEQGIETSAVRLRNNVQSAGWWRFAEFQVFPATVKEDNEHVYSNVETAMKAKITDASATLSGGEITLQKDDYIGLKLDNIRGITKIDVGKLPSGTQLQTSMNGVIWNAYDATKETNARYIRIINVSNAAIDMDIETFVVDLFVLSPAKLLECTTPIAPGWGQAEDMRPLKNDGNLFDNKLATGAEIGGLPSIGEVAVFDLGQRRDIQSFRYYVVETQMNYLRDGVFEVADDPHAPNDEWTPILEVGDGIENEGSEDANRAAKNYAEFTHDSKNPGNMYKEGENVNASGRYLRLRFTANNKNRAVFFNELLINEGEYISSESNKDVISSVIEEQGKGASNMFDGDIASVFKPSAQNGTFTYYLSDPTNARTIRFAQNGEASDAVVKATLLDSTKRAQEEVVVLGTLNQSLTEFIIPENKILMSVEVSWKTKIPELSEIITTGNRAVVNKDSLKSELDKGENENWTKATKEAYQKMERVAQDIYDNAYASQDSVDMAEGAMKSVRLDAKEKADTTKLKALVADAKEQYDGDIELYSSRVFASYELVLQEAIVALEDEENISVDIEAQLSLALSNAEKALVYSTIQVELAQVSLANDEGKYPEADYSKSTFAVYKQAKKTLADMLTLDATQRQLPTDVYRARTAYRNASVALADITQLRTLLASFDGYEVALYETTGFEAYEKAATEARKLLETGSIEQVTKAEESLREKEAALVYKSSVELDAVIKELEKLNEEDYTSDSFGKLSTALEDAKRDVAQNDDGLNKGHIQKLTQAKTQLVDLREYNHVIEVASRYKASDYTKDSFTILEKALKDSEAVKVNGSAERIKDACLAIEKAFDTLVPLAKDLGVYQTSIQKKDATLYTEETYRAYQESYDAIMSLAVDNTSVEVFQKARDAFELADSKLVLKGADYTAVYEALKKVPTQLSLYTEESVKKLQEAMDAVVYGKKKDEQGVVDAYAKQLQDALGALTYKGADYSKVTAILTKVPSDASKYTQASWKALQDVLKDVDYTLHILEQNRVDAYVDAIQKAIDGLVLKTEDTGNGGSEGNPGSNNGGSNGNGGTNSGNNQTRPGGVDTSDTTRFNRMIVVLLLSGTLLIVGTKKMRKTKTVKK